MHIYIQKHTQAHMRTQTLLTSRPPQTRVLSPDNDALGPFPPALEPGCSAPTVPSMCPQGVGTRPVCSWQFLLLGTDKLPFLPQGGLDPGPAGSSVWGAKSAKGQIRGFGNPESHSAYPARLRAFSGRLVGMATVTLSSGAHVRAGDSAWTGSPRLHDELHSS